MQAIFSPCAPMFIGTYVSAMLTSNLLYRSSQTPINPLTIKIEAKNIEGQSKRVIENLQLVLETDVLGLMDIVKSNVFLSDMDLFPVKNEIYTACFGDTRPARTNL